MCMFDFVGSVSQVTLSVNIKLCTDNYSVVLAVICRNFPIYTDYIIAFFVKENVFFLLIIHTDFIT